MLPLVSHGANLFDLWCPLPNSSALYVQNWFPIGPAVWPHFPVFWIVDPIKPPKMPPWGIVGRIVFSLCPFPDESTEVYQIWCQSVQPFDSFPRLFNLWPPNPPPPDVPPGVLRGDLYLAYAHSQMNPQTRTKVGANRSSRLTAYPDLWMFNPLKPQVPPCVSRGNLFGVYPFPYESTHVYQIWCQSDQPFESSPDFWICDPLTPHMSRGELYLAYVHSQTNPQTCTKFGANRFSRLTASQTFGFVTP